MLVHPCLSHKNEVNLRGWWILLLFTNLFGGYHGDNGELAIKYYIYKEIYLRKPPLDG